MIGDYQVEAAIEMKYGANEPLKPKPNLADFRWSMIRIKPSLFWVWCALVQRFRCLPRGRTRPPFRSHLVMWLKRPSAHLVSLD